MDEPIANRVLRMMPFGQAAIFKAVLLIRAGEVVAVPTETVYGLAADATNAEAVARIYAAKGRPAFNPLIVHVADLAAAEQVAVFDDDARKLAQAFWPGPLTLVLRSAPNSPVANLVHAGLPTVAVRVPAHRAMQALLRAAGVPLAAPSANPSGAISPTRPEHVLAGLAGRIPLIINDGATEAGLESTIVALVPRARLLRPGTIPAEAIEAVLGRGLDAASSMIEAPGQLASHYAPRKPLRLDAAEARDGEWLIGFGAVAGDDNLSAGADLVEAAARLFDALHRADASPAAAIAVAPVPLTGIGIAINDRLRRAAHR